VWLLLGSYSEPMVPWTRWQATVQHSAMWARYAWIGELQKRIHSGLRTARVMEQLWTKARAAARLPVVLTRVRTRSTTTRWACC